MRRRRPSAPPAGQRRGGRGRPTSLRGLRGGVGGVERAAVGGVRDGEGERVRPPRRCCSFDGVAAAVSGALQRRCCRWVQSELRGPSPACDEWTPWQRSLHTPLDGSAAAVQLGSAVSNWWAPHRVRWSERAHMAGGGSWWAPGDGHSVATSALLAGPLWCCSVCLNEPCHARRLSGSSNRSIGRITFCITSHDITSPHFTSTTALQSCRIHDVTLFVVHSRSELCAPEFLTWTSKAQGRG